MDVESLAKQLILKNMTPEQQKAVLESIRESVKQSKEVQKQRIGQNVAVVVEALKKIEADIRARYDEVGNAIEQRVANIKDGKDGVDGIDGARGIDGRPGRDGAQGPAGAPGKDGRDGVDGVDGVSVTDAKIDFDGSLIISLSNGREINVGEVVAPDVAEKIRVVANGGGTSQAVIDSLASLQQQINALIPSQTGNAGKFLTTNGTALSWGDITTLVYEGTWNASTNTPTLVSSVGQNGHYYVVSTSGSTNLNGITDWVTGDWAIFNGSTWQKIDQTNLVSSVNGEVGAVVLDAADVGAIATITSTDGSVTISTVGTSSDLSVATAGSTTNVLALVRNTTGATLTKGTVVYISGSTGQNPTVSKAIATGDATSAQTLGIMTADLSNNSNGYVTLIGLVSNINTSAFTDGQQLYLSPTTAGTYTATKPYAPDHLVYIGVVERAHPTQGKIFVKVQNGYEMDELHNVSAQNPTNGQVLIYNTTTNLWEKNTLTAGTGVSVTNGAGSITIANTGVTSVSGTSPIASSGGATPAISLSSGYGDTQNPYASKTANFVLAAPNGAAGVPTFRAVVASDIPTLNQNTTGNAGTVTNGIYTTGSYADPTWITSLAGSKITGNISGNAANVTGTVAIANGGTGQTTRQDAMDALAGAVTSGQYLRGNGTDVVMSAIQASDVPTLNQNTTGNAGTVTNGAYVNVANTFTATQTISSANLAFTGTGNRITGDFSNATVASRLTFQTSTTNGATVIQAIPNGTSTISALQLYPNTTGLNTPFFNLLQSNSETQFYSDRTGSGSFVPMTFYTGGGERMRIDSSGNVGINTSSPTAKLDIAAGALGTTAGSTVSYQRLYSTTANGDYLEITNTRTSAGSDWTTAGSRLQQKVDFTWMAYIQFNGGSGTTNDGGISFGTGLTNTSSVSIPERMRIDSSGGLILAGSTAQKATGTTWSNPSDQRLKNNIRDYAKGTAELMQVRVREWEYNGKGGTTEGIKGLGVVADEVMEVLPNTVDNYEAKLNADDEEITVIKKFDATEITWLLVKTVQEQQALIEELKTKVVALEAR